MIRSGLVNQHKGDGFNKGFPHQRNNNARDETIRPYVDTIDTGFGKPSDIKQTAPAAVKYRQIFTKSATPDERLYLLKQAQLGISKQTSIRREPVPMPSAAPPTLPSQPPEQPVGEAVPAEVDDNAMPELIAETPTSEQGFFPEEPLFDEEMRAEDVVYPPIHQETFAEDERAQEDWIDQNMSPVFTVEDIPYEEPVVYHKHEADDILTLQENSFGAENPVETVEPVLEVAVRESKPQELAIQINGIGPRRHTDLGRLKIVHQEKRISKFEEKRMMEFVPDREKISRWKTMQERSDARLIKEQKRQRQERVKQFDRDIPAVKQIAYEPSAKLLEEPSKKSSEPKAEAPKKNSKKAAPSTAQNLAKRNNLVRIIEKLSKKEAELKKKGKKLSNNQFKVLLKAEQDLKALGK